MRNEFQYQMLDRMRSDCEYFLGYGNRCTKDLWGKSVDKHIEAMRRIWNELKEKPKWLSLPSGPSASLLPATEAALII